MKPPFDQEHGRRIRADGRERLCRTPKGELLATGEKVNNLPSPHAIPDLGVDSRRQLGRILASRLQARTGTREGGLPKDASFSDSDLVLRFQHQYA
jgi:hypothetical protein